MHMSQNDERFVIDIEGTLFLRRRKEHFIRGVRAVFSARDRRGMDKVVVFGRRKQRASFGRIIRLVLRKSRFVLRRGGARGASREITADAKQEAKSEQPGSNFHADRQGRMSKVASG